MKFAAALVLGCLYFGFLKLATAELEHARGHDIIPAENLTDVIKDHDRSGAISIATASLKGPNSPPYRIPVNLVLCYSCNGCPTVDSSTEVRTCPFSYDPTTNGLCVTYSEQYNTMLKPYYIRGCATELGNCNHIGKSHSSHADVVKLTTCSVCEGDKCNAASRSIGDFTIAFFVMMITPLIAKYTLT